MTVTVVADAPAVALEGEMELTVGLGFDEEVVVVVVVEDDVDSPPPPQADSSNPDIKRRKVTIDDLRLWRAAKPMQMALVF